VKEIDLGRCQFALVDDEDFDWLNQWNWFATWNKKLKKYYAQKNVWDGRQRSISMHQEILGKRLGFEIDHINRDSLDNRRRNLRFVTRSQNMLNGSMRKNRTGFRGVERAGNKWCARLRVGATRHYSGVKNTILEAAAAYNELVGKYCPEFGVLNEL
jgi:hypothetical protein